MQIKKIKKNGMERGRLISIDLILSEKKNSYSYQCPDNFYTHSFLLIKQNASQLCNIFLV